MFVTRAADESSSSVLGTTDGAPWYLDITTTASGLDLAGVYTGPLPMLAIIIGTVVFSPYW